MRRSCPARASQGGVKKCFLFPKLIKSTTYDNRYIETLWLSLIP